MSKWYKAADSFFISVLMIVILVAGAIADESNQEDASIPDIIEYIPIFSEGGRIQQAEVNLSNDWVISNDKKYASRIVGFSVVDYAIVEVTMQYGVVLEDGSVLFCFTTSTNIELNKSDGDIKLAYGYARNFINMNYKGEQSKYSADVAIRMSYFDEVEYSTVTLSLAASELEPYYNKANAIDTVKGNETQESEVSEDKNKDAREKETVLGASTEYDIRKFRWGDSQEHVREIEGKPSHEGQVASGYTLFYDATCVGLNATLGYSFNQNGLSTVVYLFSEEHSNASRYISDYEKVKNALIKKYGEPSFEEEVWDTDSHKSYYSDNKGEALEFGYLTYFTQFNLERTIISFAMTADNFEVMTRLTYDSKVNPSGETDYSNDI